MLQNYHQKRDTARQQKVKKKFCDHVQWYSKRWSGKWKSVCFFGNVYNFIFNRHYSWHSGLTSCNIVSLMYTQPIVDLKNAGYAILCTDAYILNVHVNNIDATTYIFDVALPCSDHFLQHNQPILACCLQYQNMKQQLEIPCGFYHICAKVQTLLSNGNLIYLLFPRSYPLLQARSHRVLF